METLEIEDLYILLHTIDSDLKYSNLFSAQRNSLLKSRTIIEQMIKDREFEQSQTTLPKL